MGSHPVRLAAAAAIIAAACCLPPAAAAWTLDLPDSLLAREATVRVGDLAPGVAPAGAAAVVVVAGGRPGASVEVSGRAILRRLAMAGEAAGVALTGAERCRIVFAGRSVPAELLHERVAAVLQPHVPPAPSEAPPSWLELELPEAPVVAGDDLDVSWPQPRPLAPGRNLLTVAVESGGRQHRLSVAATLHAYGRVASPNAAVARGQAVAPDDLRWQWTDLALAGTGLVTDPQALQDMQLARDLAPGDLLQQRDLAPRPLVRRGETVDLTLSRGGVAAVLRVECRQDGLLDQPVSVRNPLTGRLLVARVAGPGVVTIGR
jgi:flagellar basal body P-ring formation protein FlgA